MKHNHQNHDLAATKYKKNSLSIPGAISLGTGVMIGAGILALTGQIAELAGSLFPLAFFAAAIVTAFSAYSYIKMSNAFPSAGGIGMFLEKAYGRTAVTAGSALLMYFSMVINESLVAKTFGTYSVQLFDIDPGSWVVTALAISSLVLAFLINISGNRLIGLFSLIMALIKICGILIFAVSGLWLADFNFEITQVTTHETSLSGFLAAMALSILAYKGFTTITNSGSEIVNPHKNVGRAIIFSILICVVVYSLVALAVAGNLSLPEIVAAKDFALAQAARPAFGEYGLWFTVILAVIATISGLIASVFAVSRMLAMLTDMKLVPHSHFNMPGNIQKHTLVYTVVFAIFLTVFFDLSRIASLGAVFYLTMDIVVHWGVFRYLRKQIAANGFILISAIFFDILILASFLLVKARTDMMVIYTSIVGIFIVFLGERYYLKGYRSSSATQTKSNEWTK